MCCMALCSFLALCADYLATHVINVLLLSVKCIFCTV